MSTKTPRTSKRIDRTDPRPKCLFAGTDADGCEHYFMPHADAVVVVEDGARVWRESFTDTTATIESWVLHIEDARGWADQRLFTSMADALLAQTEP